METGMEYSKEQLNHFSSKILEAAYTLHTDLGPGLLEKAYETFMIHELLRMGLNVESQVPLPLIYKDETIDFGYRADLVVEKSVIVELKAVDTITTLHESQLLTYLKFSNCRLGLLVNFNVVKLSQGIRRMVNRF